MRKQSEGLTKEYDRLLEEHAKLQVSMLWSPLVHGIRVLRPASPDTSGAPSRHRAGSPQPSLPRQGLRETPVAGWPLCLPLPFSSSTAAEAGSREEPARQCQSGPSRWNLFSG